MLVYELSKAYRATANVVQKCNMCVELFANIVLTALNVVKAPPYYHLFTLYPLEILPNSLKLYIKGLRARFLGLEIRRNVVKNEKIL